MNWNQPICCRCWFEQSPNRQPARMRNADPEQCAYCGGMCFDGIYVRADPSTVPYPAADDADEEVSA